MYICVCLICYFHKYANVYIHASVIADDLGSDTDPALLIKCAEFFLQHSQYDKAVHLMITAGEYEKGLNLCIKHGVKIQRHR